MSLRRTLVFALLILLPLFGSTLHVHSAPFGVPVTAGTELSPPASSRAERATPSFIQKLWFKTLAIQRDLHRQLAAAVRKLKSDGGVSAAWLLASLSFIYGVLHAVGPGHGKAVISAYVFANEQTMRRGVALSFLASLVQGFTAVILVGILAIVMNAAGLQIKAATAHLETGSYAFIALVGMWMLSSQLRQLFGVKKPHAHSHGHDHAHHDDCCDHSHMPDPEQLEGSLSIRKAAAIIFAVGIRPCTGAVVVLVFALANGLFLAGVAATFAMALGTAITVSALAVLAVGSRQLALRIAGNNGQWVGYITTFAGIGGGLLVMMLGVTLFFGSLLGPARPF